MTLNAGTRLGPYEILAPIGAGWMGEVYRARDEKLDRDVAIKVLPQSVAADPETLASFEREAKAVAALSHPNILSIFDFGKQDGGSYAVMELPEGETLRGKLDAGPIPPSQKEIRPPNRTMRGDCVSSMVFVPVAGDANKSLALRRKTVFRLMTLKTSNESAAETADVTGMSFWRRRSSSRTDP